ncbi:hypothetical protein A6M27_01255 [Acidithiobacillus thiooxidans]|uniref:Conjugal transfer protein TrbI n=1 Tax=Acidithiobacillus thiooxidans TaxID=930 RepID=A0A1C2JMY8_ACITH|nr:TrbI/VirB10 family protein [Acidithiobacillus thiooxidans]OCX71327.1 hypothetical protein A6O24_15515 [Acidithiobacillus thiooxidans]OCX72488.1 hypothetical protein A6P07_09825 [Acidithiobacillus thiooxidans]OCX74735.1 hypothetical protein A6M23_05040 [Acidithiobacillus thiooxidans]OCX83004.1 hypothetical protein A6O26_08205 [Acidithiobacillus thiooxidans]OCX86958.1 hypothetical protein A6P08_04610 [Acidithiobacillus thiooxidans]
MSFFSRKNGKASNPSAPDSSNGPSLGSPLQGTTPSPGATPINVKPDANKQSTRISKRAMYTGVAILGLAGLGGFEYVQHHPIFANTKKVATTTKVGPAKTPETSTIPVKHRPSKPKNPEASSNNSNDDHSSTGETSGKSTSNHQPPAKPKKNPYAAQDMAFQATLGESTSGGSGANALGWKTGSTASRISSAQQANKPTTLPVATSSKDRKKKRESDISNDLVKREVSPYELLQGSVIPAVLQTGIKSYLPGELTAVVSDNVYSSVNGASLLVPAGSKLIGTYNTSTTLGVNRLAVAWTRIEFPNGTYINLPGFNGAGGQGYSGFSGEVNDHTWLIFKNALLMSIVDAGMAIASPSSSTSATGQISGNTALQDSEQSLVQTFGQAESQLLEKYIDIAPTITIKPGYVFQVVATQDMVFPGPYNPQMQTDSGKVEQPKQPTEANPYS